MSEKQVLERMERALSYWAMVAAMDMDSAPRRQDDAITRAANIANIVIALRGRSHD